MFLWAVLHFCQNLNAIVFSPLINICFPIFILNWLNYLLSLLIWLKSLLLFYYVMCSFWPFSPVILGFLLLPSFVYLFLQLSILAFQNHQLLSHPLNRWVWSYTRIRTGVAYIVSIGAADLTTEHLGFGKYIPHLLLCLLEFPLQFSLLLLHLTFRLLHLFLKLFNVNLISFAPYSVLLNFGNPSGQLLFNIF